MSNSTATPTSAASSDDFVFKLYRYTPSLPAAIIFVGVFGSLTSLHLWRLWRRRALYFIAFTVGGLFQVIGYCGRISSHFDPTALAGFIIQAILILVAPALYAASIYMILGRLIRALHAHHLSLIPVDWLTRIFVTGDVISFTLQAGGGGIQAGGSLDLFNIGEKVIVVGLFIQIVFFGVFIFTTALFQRRISMRPTTIAEANAVPWRRHLLVLYAVSLLIFVRSIFRVIEYLQGNNGYIISHEVFLYIFDSTLMAAVMVILLVYYVDDLDGQATEGNKSPTFGSGSDHVMIDISS